MKALGKTDENPNNPLGVDLARICLGAPPRPPLVGMTRPSGPGLAGDEGCFCFLFSVLHYLYFICLTDVWLLFQVLPTAQ